RGTSCSTVAAWRTRCPTRPRPPSAAAVRDAGPSVARRPPPTLAFVWAAHATRSANARRQAAGHGRFVTYGYATRALPRAPIGAGDWPTMTRRLAARRSGSPNQAPPVASGPWSHTATDVDRRRDRCRDRWRFLTGGRPRVTPE